MDVIKIEGPFVIGFDRIEKKYSVYNFNLEEFCFINREDSNLML